MVSEASLESLRLDFCFKLIFYLFLIFHKYNLQTEEKQRYNNEEQNKTETTQTHNAFDSKKLSQICLVLLTQSGFEPPIFG